jgi:hypothetical protein
MKSLWEQNGPDYRPDLELGKFQMVHGIEIDIAGSCSASELTKCAAAEISVSPHLALLQFKKIGGANGWYFANILCWLRGASDLLAGGIGLRPGRRDPHTLAAGDALDFWRVESFELDRRLHSTCRVGSRGELP